MKINKKKVWTELSSPFLTLLIGAIISGLLIPYITTTWQNHAKALEIKTGEKVVSKDNYLLEGKKNKQLNKGNGK